MTRPLQDAVAITHRAAMRAAVPWFAATDQEWAAKLDFITFAVLRANLTCAVLLRGADAEIVASTQAAADTVAACTANAYLSTADARIAGAAHGNSWAAVVAARDAARAALAQTAADAAFYVSTIASNTDFEAAIKMDAQALRDLGELSDLPLWQADNPLSAEWRQSRQTLSQITNADFWIDWYQRALDGTPQNWDMLRDVALIDDATWEESGDTLDRAIQRIVERHRLLEEVRRLKAELAEARPANATSVIHHRDHNHPPELLPSHPLEIAIPAQVIAAGLNEAEEELQQSQPSPTRLRHIGYEIRKAVMSMLTYCAGLGDEALKGAAKEVGASVGKWLGRGAVGYIIAQSQTFQELAGALIRLADKF